MYLADTKTYVCILRSFVYVHEHSYACMHDVTLRCMGISACPMSMSMHAIVAFVLFFFFFFEFCTYFAQFPSECTLHIFAWILFLRSAIMLSAQLHSVYT